MLAVFQLTPSRRATVFLYHVLRHGEYFNSRPHGGRLKKIRDDQHLTHFNSRPHGGRHTRCSGNAVSRYFNSRPHGGRLREQFRLGLASHFNSRPHGGRRGTMMQETTQGYFNSRPHGGRPKLICMLEDAGAFQLTPSRRATRASESEHQQEVISTHALTEGDGKFRQIFLLNRGYAYSISLYFLPHFISLLPQILSFQQKSFKFQVRIFLLFSVHLAFALQNQCVHHVKYRFCTNMFYFVFVLFTQIVKPQTIGLFIYDFF